MAPRFIAWLALLAATATTAAHAQEWPTRPLRIVVMAAPGGLVDIVARTLSTHMSPTLGQPVVVENRPGGGGNIAADFVAKAPADGYTLLSTGSNHAVNQSLLPNPGFDYNRDLAPVSMVAVGSQLIVATNSLPVSNIAELVALARQKPGTVAIGHAPIGTPGHVAAELLVSLGKADFTLVTYKGIGAILPDAISGQVQVTLGALPPILPLVKAGRLKALAVTGAKRDPVLPDVPTVAESGIPGFEVLTWLCILTTGGTPRPVIDRLNAEIRRVMAMPEVRDAFLKQGAEPWTNSPDELDTYIRSEAKKWGDVLKNARVKQ